MSICSEYHRSRKIIEKIVFGDKVTRDKFVEELTRLEKAQVDALRKDEYDWPEDFAQFLFWCTPDIIICAFENISE